MFTPDEREQLRAQLSSAAQSDPRLTGAAHLGSAALGRQDGWSDIDLALCLSRDAAFEDIVGDWTERLYRCGAVTHLDVRRGAILYRVFLLENTLQIDISFWPAADFRATGEKFKLIFGTPNHPSPTPPPAAGDLIGMAWLYALHVRSALARNRLLQAEYMLSGMRNETLSLACLRHGLVAIQGRGLDDLPHDLRERLPRCFPHSLAADRLRSCFRAATHLLLEEIEHADSPLAAKLRGPLVELCDSSSPRDGRTRGTP